MPSKFPFPDNFTPKNQILNLHEHLVTNPPATFFMRMGTDELATLGLFRDDILVVDRSLEPRDGDVVVGVLDGEFVVREYLTLDLSGDAKIIVLTGGPHSPVEAEVLGPDKPGNQGDRQFEVWGVVAHSVHSYRR